MTINRPEKRNALNPDLFTRLTETLRSVNDDGETLVVVVRGAGEKAFSAGFDLSWLNTPEDADTKDNIEDLILAVEMCTVPVIAMIYGYCIGAGCALATACDLRLAADTAQMGVTASKVGVIYPPGAIRDLINLVGVSATKELLYSARLIDAARAAEIGLVDRVVPADSLAVVTYELAAGITGNSALSVRATKEIISKLLDNAAVGLRAREVYSRLQEQVTAGKDLKEG